jgi:hypothetical protein
MQPDSSPRWELPKNGVQCRRWSYYSFEGFSCSPETSASPTPTLWRAYRASWNLSDPDHGLVGILGGQAVVSILVSQIRM